VSTGHVSRAEAGDRPARPAVLNGYERALGVRLSAGTTGAGIGDRLDGTRHGEDADGMERRAFTAAIATVAAGGPLGEPVARAVITNGDFDAYWKFHVR
jgi:hypothetical protein